MKFDILSRVKNWLNKRFGRRPSRVYYGGRPKRAGTSDIYIDALSGAIYRYANKQWVKIEMMDER